MSFEAISNCNVLIYALTQVDVEDSLSGSISLLRSQGACIQQIFADDGCQTSLVLEQPDESLIASIGSRLATEQPALVLLPAMDSGYQRLAALVWEAMRRSNVRKLIVGELEHPLSEISGWHASAIAPPAGSTAVRQALRAFRKTALGNGNDGNAYRQYDTLDCRFPLAYTDCQPLPRSAYRIDVIIRTSGRESLKRALDSVFAQAWADIGLILINISHSPLAGWLETLAVPSRVAWQVIDAPSAARAHAANLGLAQVSGEAFVFLDDDDELYPAHFTALSQALEMAPNAVFAYGGTRIEQHDRDGRLHSVDLLAEPFDEARLYLGNFIPIHAALIRTRVIAQGARFDEDLDWFEDWDFWLQCIALGRVTSIPDVIALYHVSDASGVSKASVLPVYERWLKRQGPAVIEQIAHWALSADTPKARGLRRDVESARSHIAAVERQLRDTQARANTLEHELVRLTPSEDTANLTKEISLLEAATATLRGERERLGQECSALTRDNQIKQQELQHLENQVAGLRHQIDTLYASTSWRMTAPLRASVTSLRSLARLTSGANRVIHQHGGWPGGVVHLAQRFNRAARRQGVISTLRRGSAILATPAPTGEASPTRPRLASTRVSRPAISLCQQTVDVVICIHNALDDVRRCIASVQEHTLSPYHLILVDDGSGEATRDYLAANFTDRPGITLIRNETAGGYTKAANSGMRASQAEFVVLLNSDTVVGPEWLDRLHACLESDSQIGLVGPLSNCASWQSVPKIESDTGGDWAENPLPADCQPADMAVRVARDSMRIYPRIGFINGFCQLIRRAALNEIGLLDEQAFPQGYGEENDMCLRLRKAGWLLAVADDVWVYHAQSKSYSNERRKKLCDAAGVALARKHGQFAIDEGVALCRDDVSLFGIRQRVAHLDDRLRHLAEGRARFGMRRILFLLPSTDAGGGANVIMTEAAAMRRMGVDVQILNLEANATLFEHNYASYGIPVNYVQSPQQIPEIAESFDAVIASIYYSVDWLQPLQTLARPPVLGYYVQDFEPFFFSTGTNEYIKALASYSAIPALKRFCKTHWNSIKVHEETGMDCAVVGASFDVDLFRPSQRQPGQRVRLCAMIRPNSPYRSPALTMQTLGEIFHLRPNEVEITTFGVDSDDPAFLALRHDFTFSHLGKLHSPQIAALLDQTDVFVDLSTHQAMGLTALEAMGCYTAVVIPGIGGTPDFAKHGETALFIDPKQPSDCTAAILRLIDEPVLRDKLAKSALTAVQQHFPERAALRILETLFV